MSGNSWRYRVSAIKPTRILLLALFFGVATPKPTTVAASTEQAQQSPYALTSGVWRIRQQWSEVMEQRYARWIKALFRPLESRKNRGWRVLHQVLRNPKRNTLYNRLGYREDSRDSRIKIDAVADCGDTPYMLRAYFAWKHGLPFQFRHCDRGTARNGPKCHGFVNNLTHEFDYIGHPVARFNAFLRQAIAWRVHSGTMRTLPNDNQSDFYPIPLSRNAIVPGTVFVDTGGHALVVSQWDDTGLFGIDGHPDKTVTRKVFSQKHFPYAAAVDTGGFKAFRPIRVINGRFITASNRALGTRFSTQQYVFTSPKRFFAHMAALLDH
jgi:hypothetical protein